MDGDDFVSGPKPKDRVGESNTMKNGMMATITRYKSSAELDVQFADGVTVANKTYASFKSGSIGHPDTLHKAKVKDRTGETKTMFNGMNATIVRYRSAKDIDVVFEDGKPRAHCSYKEFTSGHIAHPDCTTVALANQRVGETVVMNCGLAATITKYNNYHDIEITFEDGAVIYPVDYGRFSDHSVSHPLLDGNMSLQEAAVAFYLKELGFAKCAKGTLKDLGLGNFEIDLYHPEAFVAIEVDGRFHKSESAVKRDVEKNLKCHNSGITLYRLRDKDLPVLTDGLSYNYVIDGVPIYNGLYDCAALLASILKHIGISLPSAEFIDFRRDLDAILQFHFSVSLNHQSRKHIGEKVWHEATSQFMTLVEYKDYLHITVQFDDGEIVPDKNYGCFKKGEIKHPNQTPTAKKNSRLGESRMMNCGDVATIIEYRDAEDIDVAFEDGTIRTSVTYYNFQNRNIAKIKKNIKQK